MSAYLQDDEATSEARSHEDPIHLVGSLARAILRRWKLVVFINLTLVVLIYAAMQTRPDIYEVEARLLVKVGPENLNVPSTVLNGALISDGVRKEDINSDVILLTTHHLISYAVDQIGVEAFRVVKPPPVTLSQKLRRSISSAIGAVTKRVEALLISLKLTREYTEREELILKIEDNIFVSREGESDVIVLSLEFPSPPLAVRILNEMIDKFITDRALARRSIGSEDFFAQQVVQNRAELDRIEIQLSSLRQAHELTSVEQERGLLLEQAARLKGSMIDAQQARASVQPIRHFAQGSDTGAVEPIFGGAPYEVVLSKIGSLMVQLTTDFDSQSTVGRAAMELRQKIGALVLLLERSVENELTVQSADIERVQARLEKLNQAEQALDNLLRDRELVIKRLADYARRLEEDRISNQLDENRVANIALLAAPREPIEPAGPQRLMMSVISLPLGLILGICFAGLLGYLDTRIYDRTDIARVKGLMPLGEFSAARLKG